MKILFCLLVKDYIFHSYTASPLNKILLKRHRPFDKGMNTEGFCPTKKKEPTVSWIDMRAMIMHARFQYQINEKYLLLEMVLDTDILRLATSGAER